MGEMQTDPSMEEILASIKRVIAEDNRGQPRARRAAPRRRSEPRVEPPRADEDVLELDDPVTEHGSLLSERRRRGEPAAARRSVGAAQRSRRRPIASPLEAVVRDMLRPMLKEWLDENLPEIVEELVTREIARITGREALARRLRARPGLVLARRP